MDTEVKRKTRILIADDNLFVRRQLRELLDKNADWEVCGEAADGMEAVYRTKDLAPDLVVMDLSMPLMNGLKATQEIGSFAPTLPIVMFSMYLSPHFSEAARRAGARGVVSKSQPREIIEAVEAVLAGENFFPSRGSGRSTPAATAEG
jgi:DNA-binding NarL/FixJ family response regulator